ncbi:hypothetical protein [Streptomyces sp. NPDC048663]|uniref:hypothetical protein n=1 Tax=Streptomyces sp. NPDC048663 TaxID=3155638 RepID=UPI00343820C0
MSGECGQCGEATASGYLCHRHTVTLARRLALLPGLDSDLTAYLVPAAPRFGERVGGGGATSRPPINLDVLDLLQANRAAQVMRSWRVDVQRERWPERSAPPPASLAADCRWIGMELEWIVADYPAAGDLAREVKELEAELRSLGAELPADHVRVCIAVTDDQGTVCGAVLTWRPGQVLRCRTCRTEYRSAQDLALLQHYQPTRVA